MEVVFGRKAVPMHPEDQKIVETAKELCRQLNFYKTNPQTISWRERVGVRRVPTEYFMIFRGGPFAGSIQLSKAAMGRLTPEEWKPLIASGLIYFKNLNREYLKTFLTTLIPYYLVVFPFVLFLTGNYLSGPSLPITVARYTIFASILIGSILVFFRMLVLWKRFFFKADLQASALVGKESLLLSLKKIASIDQSNHRSRKGFVRPSVDERINHLTNSTPQDQP